MLFYNRPFSWQSISDTRRLYRWRQDDLLLDNIDIEIAHLLEELCSCLEMRRAWLILSLDIQAISEASVFFDGKRSTKALYLWNSLPFMSWPLKLPKMNLEYMMNLLFLVSQDGVKTIYCISVDELRCWPAKLVLNKYYKIDFTTTKFFLDPFGRYKTNPSRISIFFMIYRIQ